MNSKHLLSVIRHLNEDQYDNLTIKELYEKLGKKKFVEYLEFRASKVVASLKNETDFDSKFDMIVDSNRIIYMATTADIQEQLIFKTDISDLSLSYSLNYEFLDFYWFPDPRNSKDFITQLEESIISIYNSPKAKKYRAALILMKKSGVMNSFRIFQLSSTKYEAQAWSPGNTWIKWSPPYLTPEECAYQLKLNLGAPSNMKIVVVYKNRKPALIDIN